MEKVKNFCTKQTWLESNVAVFTPQTCTFSQDLCCALDYPAGNTIVVRGGWSFSYLIV